MHRLSMESYSPELRRAVSHLGEDDYYFQDDLLYPDDIFLASYPRSGNHYIRFILLSALYYLQHGSFPGDFSIMRSIPDINTRHLETAITTPRVIKTHYPFDPRYHHIFHLVRDPRDVIVSYYHYTHEALHLFYDDIKQSPTLAEFVDLFLNGRVWPGDLRHHSHSYLARPSNTKYTLVRYEQLTSSPGEQVPALLRHFGIHLDTDVIQRLIKHTSFENMSRVHHPASALQGGVEANREGMLRKGTIGDYKNHLPQDTLRKIEQAFRDYLEHYGYA